MSGSERDKDTPPGALGSDDQPTTTYPSPTAGAPASAWDPTAPSWRLLATRFEILGELGRGGMGIAYKARDRETGEVVALKALKPEIAADSAVVERFKNELRLARKITHKNVCRTYDLHRFGDVAVIAMEYVEGESLRQGLRRYAPLSVRKGLEFARQICAALAEAHAQGIVHRDLKPENVMLDDSGQVKVMDFGIARSVDVSTTATGSIVGTPAYMAPEQAEGKPVDHRADIYGLGLILYETFTGRLPFHADSPVGLVHKQIYETPPPARSVDPYLPIFLDRAIEKCLEKDPKKRFQSVAELEAALEEQAVPELPGGEPVPAPHLSVWGKRDWALLALGVIGLVYFLAYRNTVFPAATKPLEVDAITARRVATDLASRLGRPFPPGAEVQLQFKGEEYRDDLIAAVFGGEGSGRGSSRFDLPLYWRVTFSSPFDRMMGFTGERYALVDSKGKVQEFSHPYPPGWRFPNYQAPPVEERRAKAKEAFERVYGPLPPDVVPVEWAGGEQGASYTAAWRPVRPVDSPVRSSASLQAENLVAAECILPWTWGPNDLRTQFDIMSGGLQNFCWIFMLPLAVAVLVFFGIGQCHRSPLLWKRAPLAVVLGLAGVWLLAPTINQVPNSIIVGPPPSLPLLLGGGLAAGTLILAALVTAEYYLGRRMPSSVASYALAWRGRLADPAVGLAIVRGALAGLGLAAGETLMAHRSLAMSGEFLSLFGTFVDPTAVGQASTSRSPALFVVSAAFLNGVVIGMILIGLVWGVSGYREFTKYRSRILRFCVLGGNAALALLFTTGLRLQFGQVLGFGLGVLLLFLLLLSLSTWLLLLYDVLTVIVAVGTAVLWTLNYPLLQIFQNLGNSGEWAVFIGWGALVLAAVAVAFRSELARVRERWQAQIQ